MSKLEIVVADDHTLMRQGLCKILDEQPDWQVVAQASNGREAVKLVMELAPAVAIFDIGMPLLNGIEATRQLARRMPDLKVLIFQPVDLCTASLSDSVSERGADRYELPADGRCLCSRGKFGFPTSSAGRVTAQC